MGLRDKVKEFSNSLPLMEGREKGDLVDLHGTPVTIIDFGFMQDKKGDYAVFIVKEDPANFYFAGMVLTDNLKTIEADGDGDELRSEGLPVLLYEKEGKENTYTAVIYYPTEEDVKKHDGSEKKNRKAKFKTK